MSATVRDAGGAVVDDATVVYYSRARRSVSVTRTGRVEAYRPGEFTLIALVPSNPGDRSRRPDARARVEIPVTVPLPPISEVAFARVPPVFYAGTQPHLQVVVTDTAGARRDDVPVAFATSDAAVAAIDRFGFLTLRAAGTVTVTAAVDTESDALTIEVRDNPVASLTLEVGADAARTGGRAALHGRRGGCAGAGRCPGCRCGSRSAVRRRLPSSPPAPLPRLPPTAVSWRNAPVPTP